MKVTGNIFCNSVMMKFAPLALALAAGVIFFCNLYAHIWTGEIVYLPLLFLSLTGNKLVKILGGLFFALLLINLVCSYNIVLYFLFMAVSVAIFFIGIFSFWGSLNKS